MKVAIYGNQKQSPWENYAIVNTNKQHIVQFDTERVVYERCGQLNKHEYNNGRPQVYRVFKVSDLEITK